MVFLHFISGTYPANQFNRPSLLITHNSSKQINLLDVVLGFVKNFYIKKIKKGLSFFLKFLKKLAEKINDV